MKSFLQIARIVLVLIILNQLACNETKPPELSDAADYEPKYPVEIYTKVIPEHLTLGFLVSFSITIINHEDVAIENCRIVFESEYIANLNQLERLNPETRLNYPRISDIPPKSKMVFEFSSDVGNDWEFVNSQGQRYKSTWGPPNIVTIESSNHPAMKWRIERKFIKPIVLWSRLTYRYFPEQGDL